MARMENGYEADCTEDAKKAEKPNRIDWASCAIMLFDLKIILHQVFSSIHSLPYERQRRQLQG